MQEMQGTWVRSLGQEDSLEEEMAIHSSILAWENPQTEGPGGLQSIESQRVGQDWPCMQEYCGKKKKKTAMNIPIPVFVWLYFNFSWVISMNGMVRLYGRCVFNLLRNTLWELTPPLIHLGSDKEPLISLGLTQGKILILLSLSFAQLCPTLCDPMDCSPQAPLSMGFSRQEYQNGLPFPPPGDLPNPGMEPGSLALQADSLPLSHQRSPALAHLLPIAYHLLWVSKITPKSFFFS